MKKIQTCLPDLRVQRREILMDHSCVIDVCGLGKHYTVSRRDAGLKAALRSVVKRATSEFVAVDGITFHLAAGEIVGFLGPNGAGKTTTLKMLAGLLYPTSGIATVLGHVPWRRERAFLQQIALVMGQRNQLQWDIPAIDSFALNQAIYRLDPPAYRRTLGELTELLDLGPLLTKPVRTLSLGERMKCELAAALLHRPRVLFLDEPSIGLDVTSQRRIRAFIAEYNCRYEATVLLTSHYMADVEALCRRVIIIHRGQVLFDGDLRELAQRFSSYKTITVQTPDEVSSLAAFGEIISAEEGQVKLRVHKAAAARVVQRLLEEHAISDLTIEDPPIEQVIEQASWLGGRQ
jgi:ABC-2 type transport system ATP-binding protein